MLIRRLGYSCITRGFWNALVRRGRPGFWVVPRPSWLQVMDPKDVLVAAIQLQRDAGLMSSNLTVLSQYVTSLHRMPTEVMQSFFNRGFFPSGPD